MKFKPIIFSLLFITTLLLSGSAFAASFTMDISGAEGNDISTFTIFFDIQEGFTIENFALQGAADTSAMGWQINKAEPLTDADYGYGLKVDAYDLSSLMKMGNNYLTTGTLFSFDYTGVIKGFKLVKLKNDTTGEDLIENGTFTAVLLSQEAGILTSAVPVPGSIFLLSGGLFALVGISRRRS